MHIADGEGVITFVNKAYTRITGIDFEEIRGRKVEDIEREGVLYKGSVTTEVLRRRERVDSIATIHRLNKEVLVTGIPVFDENGDIDMVVTSTRDITELKDLEKQLHDLTEEHRKANEELEYLRQRQEGDTSLIYRSKVMEGVVELIHAVSATNATVLITGESGTGKELVANALYQSSPRRGKPFVKVNCAAIPSELLESELFGYEEGAFTGARRSGKPGMFELANSGVILLDEIGDMPIALQSKLLRVLQQRELMRIGGHTSIPLDLWVLASTNKDLKEEVRLGRFREDLYYRLNVVPIALPPLSERKEDIPLLAEQFCARFSKHYGRHVTLTPDALDLLATYSWPGNIRELENLIERLVVTSDGLITHDRVFSTLALSSAPKTPDGENTTSLKALVHAYEAELVRQALRREGSVRKAAKSLQVDHSTLVKKMQKMGLHVDMEVR